MLIPGHQQLGQGHGSQWKWRSSHCLRSYWIQMMLWVDVLHQLLLLLQWLRSWQGIGTFFMNLRRLFCSFIVHVISHSFLVPVFHPEEGKFVLSHWILHPLFHIIESQWLSNTKFEGHNFKICFMYAFWLMPVFRSDWNVAVFMTSFVE